MAQASASRPAKLARPILPARTARQLEQVIQLGLLVLVALMPFHAFLTTWLGSGLGHRSLLQGWKEL